MAVGNSLANRQQKTGLTAYLTNDAVKNQINNVVGGKNGDRFIASIVSAVQVNSDLQECTNPSILSAIAWRVFKTLSITTAWTVLHGSIQKQQKRM